MDSIPEPAVSRHSLILGAGVFWIAGGLVLLIRALDIVDHWDTTHSVYALVGAGLGIIKARFVLNRVIGKNIARIRQLSPHKEKICLFAFQSLQAYVFVAVMVTLGIALRATPLPVSYLFTIYVAIGLSLLLSAVEYLREARSLKNDSGAVSLD
jgi:hypothetical protein